MGCQATQGQWCLAQIQNYFVLGNAVLLHTVFSALIETNWFSQGKWRIQSHSHPSACKHQISIFISVLCIRFLKLLFDLWLDFNIKLFSWFWFGIRTEFLAIFEMSLKSPQSFAVCIYVKWPSEHWQLKYQNVSQPWKTLKMLYIFQNKIFSQSLIFLCKNKQAQLPHQWIYSLVNG